MTDDTIHMGPMTDSAAYLRAERDALAERADAAERALRDLWALWEDKQVAAWNGDYHRGHLSYANVLNERTRSIPRNPHSSRRS